MSNRKASIDGSPSQALGILAWSAVIAVGLRLSAELASRALPLDGRTALVACLALLAPCALWLTRRGA